MATERNSDDQRDQIEPEDVNSAPVSASPSTPESLDVADPADEVPVPVAMSPAEIDERAQVVEALRGTPGAIREPRDDDPRMEA